VSNKCMRLLSRKRKVLWFLALAVLALFLAPFVAVQIQERIFRHRAEQLLTDMRSLMLRKANLAEIQAVFRRWNPTGDPRGNPCRDQNCILEDFSSRRFSWVSRGDPNSQKTDWWELWMSLYRIYGGRDDYVIARGTVERWGPSIWYAVGAESSWDPAEGTHDLVGEAISGSRVSIQNAWQGLTLHANYVLGKVYHGGLHRPSVMYAHFGQNADPADIARLTKFDLSCLTRWLACREPDDLMPEAAAQFAREEPHLAQARKDHICTPYIVALMASNAGYAGIVEVTGFRTVQPIGQGDGPIATVRGIENFNPVGEWKTGESRDLVILDTNTNRIVPSLPPEVHPGNRLIILADTEYGTTTERCGIVPLNPANLELVQRTIAGDLPPPKP